MKPFAFLLLAASLLAGCGSISVSRAVFAEAPFDRTTIGGANYPIVVEGAEQIGLTPDAVARSMRFPNNVGGGSFVAVSRDRLPSAYAVLDIERLGTSTLTFIRNGERIAFGTFSLPAQDYADPSAIASTTTVLIRDLLYEASERRNGAGLFGGNDF